MCDFLPCTHLSRSLVVDDMIQARLHDTNAALLAYFYCTRDQAEPKRAQPVEILRSIIRQLSCLNPKSPIRKPVTDKWEERIDAETDDELEIEECITLLLELTRTNPAVICIDALDECNPITRRELLEAIGKVMECSEQIVKFFVSSRREDDFLPYFKKWESLQISAKDNSEDIKNFIDAELKSFTDKKILLRGNAPAKLIDDIKKTLLDRADGMSVSFHFHRPFKLRECINSITTLTHKFF
jgi:hypothetical protein